MTANENFEINLVNQSILAINCVLHIVSFDEDEICIMTKSGKVVVEGKSLKVESLSKENGQILVTGEILYLSFPKTNTGKGGAFLKRRK